MTGHLSPSMDRAHVRSDAPDAPVCMVADSMPAL
jgi:hypothetical protein